MPHDISQMSGRLRNRYRRWIVWRFSYKAKSAWIDENDLFWRDPIRTMNTLVEVERDKAEKYKAEMIAAKREISQLKRKHA